MSAIDAVDGAHSAASKCQRVVAREANHVEGSRPWARPPCLVGLEACPSAHYWSRELAALGHTVKLMPRSTVKAYLQRSKNDAKEAAAICEAVTRPSMRFVPIKTQEQQTGLMLHRTRQLLVRQRTMLSNAIRGHMAELGIISAKGRN